MFVKVWLFWRCRLAGKPSALPDTCGGDVVKREWNWDWILWHCAQISSTATENIYCAPRHQTNSSFSSELFLFQFYVLVKPKPWPPASSILSQSILNFSSNYDLMKRPGYCWPGRNIANTNIGHTSLSAVSRWIVMAQPLLWCNLPPPSLQPSDGAPRPSHLNDTRPKMFISRQQSALSDCH